MGRSVVVAFIVLACSLVACFPAQTAPLASQRAVRSQTILDSSGHLARPVTPADLASWRAIAAASSSAPRNRSAARISLGEYALAIESQPEQAMALFAAAERDDPSAKDLVGLSRYDTALALYDEGAYGEAKDAFLTLDTPATALPGYDRRTCALWLRHAAACAGYHSQHAALGIPEPPKLDPYCGAAALAVGLRALGHSYDKQAVVSHCHITEEGDNLQDLIEAGKALGMAVHAVTANDRGLMDLPKPLIAHVEQDHFIAVTAADKTGVTYLCSDCGPWPGGKVHLSWAQWHVMGADVYGSMVAAGSDWDKALSTLAGPAPILVASAGNVSGLLPSVVTLAALIKGNVVADQSPTNPGGCNRFTSAHCPSGVISCPMDKGNGSEGGPSCGDPVNLATGEEEYEPVPDLIVYNPHGPNVVWQRIYNSMAIPFWPPWTTSLLGESWSNGYNFMITGGEINNQGQPVFQVLYPNGATINFIAQTTSSGYCAMPAGTPFLLYFSASNEQFLMTWQDHSVWTFPYTPNQYTPRQLSKITDQNGHSINLIYTNGHQTSITDDSSPANTLLTLGPSSVNSGWTAATDCYGRSVCYDVEDVLGGFDWELTAVSQVFSTASPPPTVPLKCSYGYTTAFGSGTYGSGSYSGSTLDRTPAFLNTIAVPSPTGTGNSTATLYYDSEEYVGKIVDGNGNSRTYLFTNATGTTATVPSNYTKVTVANASGTNVYSYIAGYDANMDEETDLDGNGLDHDITAFSSADPYRPATEYSGDALYGITPGGSQTFTSAGSDSPGTYNWEVLSGSTVVDHGATNGSTGANGWRVSASGPAITVTTPSTAPIAAHYEVRSATASPTSAFFDVYSSTKNAATMTWDTYGHMLTLTDERGTETNNTYSTTHFPLGDLSEVQPGYNLGTPKTPTTYSYVDGSGAYHGGLVTGVTTPEPGQPTGSSSTVTTTYNYDEPGYVGSRVTLGQLTSEIAPGNSTYPTITSTWNYIDDSSYDVAGHPVGGSYVAYQPTAQMGEPIVFTNDDGKQTHYRYDARSNCTMVIDALGNETDYTYNVANQVLATLQYTPWSGSPSHSLISEVAYNYQYTGGPLASEVVENGSGTVVREVDFGYGAEGELLTESSKDYVTNPSDPTKYTLATYTYDPVYRVTSITDGDGNKTSYTYSAINGHLTLIQYPGAGTNTTGPDTVQLQAYDADGNLLTRVDGNSAVTNWLYDTPDSLLEKAVYSNSTTAPNYSLAYDSYGRATTLTDAPGSETFAYDDLDNVTETQRSWTSGPTSVETAYGYNEDGSVASMAFPGLSSQFSAFATGAMAEFTYSYDDIGRMSGLKNPLTDPFSWTYLDNSWLNTQTSEYGPSSNYDVVSTAYTYDPRGEITDLNNTNASGSTYSELGNTSDPGSQYDPTGNRLYESSSYPGYTTYSGNTTYGYDYKNELSGEGTTKTVAPGQVSQTHTTRSATSRSCAAGQSQRRTRTTSSPQLVIPMTATAIRRPTSAIP